MQTAALAKGVQDAVGEVQGILSGIRCAHSAVKSGLKRQRLVHSKPAAHPPGSCDAAACQTLSGWLSTRCLRALLQAAREARSLRYRR